MSINIAEQKEGKNMDYIFVTKQICEDVGRVRGENCGRKMLDDFL